jgi:hypothetical protein
MAINIGSIIGLVESLINTILGLQSKAASGDHAEAQAAHAKLKAISDAANNA